MMLPAPPLLFRSPALAWGAWLLLLPAAGLLSGCPKGAPGAGPKAQQGARPRKKPPPVNVNVQVGHAGVAREGQIVPVRVTLGQNEKALTGKIVLDDLRGGHTETPYELPRNGNKVYTLYAPLSQAPASLAGESAVITVTDGGKVIGRASLSPTYSASRVVLSASGDGSGLQFLDDQQTFKVEHVAPGDLPREWAGYFPADAVAVNGRAWAAMDDVQRRALRTWIEMGGHAVLCGESTSEWRDPEATALTGVTPTRLASQPAPACLQAWGDTPYSSSGGALLTVTGPLRPGASPLFAETPAPVAVVRRTLRGRVLWLGFDAFRQGVREWEGGATFWRRALDEASRTGEGAPLQAPQDVEDVRLAATALPRLPAPPLAAIVAFGITYALVFGPLNILVLRRLRRTVRAWLFVPALALGMTLAVLFVGQLWGNARTVLNSVSLLEASAGGRTADERALIGLFTPTNRAFDLTVDDTAPRLSDAGSADPRDEGAVVIGWPRYQAEGQARWDAVPLALYSTRLLRLDRPRDLNGSVEARLDFRRGAPAGGVTNATHMSLRGAYLYYHGRTHWVGDLPAGGKAPIRGEGWRNGLNGELSNREDSAAPDVGAFRARVAMIWVRAGEALLQPAARDEAWLIAECADWKAGGLTVAQVPYSHQAAILMVRIPRG